MYLPPSQISRLSCILLELIILSPAKVQIGVHNITSMPQIREIKNKDGIDRSKYSYLDMKANVMHRGDTRVDILAS